MIAICLTADGNTCHRRSNGPRDYVALAKGFPALALMSEEDLTGNFEPFAAALEGALDPIVADFRRQMVGRNSRSCRRNFDYGFTA